MVQRVHMIESGGRGGVFNHAVEVAAGLTGLGIDVVLHTATDPDAAPAELRLCRCVRWHRGSARRTMRRIRTAASYGLSTLPHLARVIGRDDVVHVQGLFALTPELIAVARLCGATVVCSPHNTFVRRSTPGGSRALDSVLRQATRILVYSDADVAALSSRRPRVARVPLVQWVPPVRSALVARWRQALAADGARLAVLPGQVREDKNPELFVRALAGMTGWCGAIVGDDLGPGRALDRLITELDAPVTTCYGYLDVDSFVAVVAAADTVVAPYEIASQSGVLAVAARLGVPTAVAAVGGLTELGTAVARDSTPAAVRDAIVAAHHSGATPVSTSDAAKLFLDEYLVARDGRRRRWTR